MSVNNLKRGEIVTIVYENTSKSEVTKRTVIPTFVPRQTMKSIDVTNLSADDQERLAEMYREYAEYHDQFVSNAYNFETWLEQTKQIHTDPMWRAFKLSNIKQVTPKE